ncbi:MAG: inositol monophosphatase [Candidatus Micrarchaeota archaeon]|nr:inositol monophosphatase [Candidatus Micrarchaeota archaeon]
MSDMEIFIKSCLIGAARRIEEARKSGLKITVKGRNDRATSADFASEQFIAGRIKKEYPGSLILSEESYHPEDLVADSLFVVDPIDGTHNFIQGIPLYGISIAHYSGGKPQAGGVYLPNQRRLYYAEKGKQSTLNGKPISVSKTKKLEDFFLLCDSRIHLAEDMGILRGLLRIERMSQHTRFLGTAVHEMCYVADGTVDAEMDFKLKPYDFAAGIFIAQQAGAKATDLLGQKWSLSTKSFLVSNGRQHKRILGILNE